MTRLTAQEIELIRKRAEKATEGPWKWDGDSLTYRKHGMLDPIVWANQYGDITVEEPDAEFIANAREDIPKLLAEVARLHAMFDEEISEKEHVIMAQQMELDHLYSKLNGGDEE